MRRPQYAVSGTRPVGESLLLIRRDDPDRLVLFVTVHTEPMLLNAGLEAGALGYVLKDTAGDDLVVAIRAALGGRRFVSREIAGGIASS